MRTSRASAVLWCALALASACGSDGDKKIERDASTPAADAATSSDAAASPDASEGGTTGGIRVPDRAFDRLSEYGLFSDLAGLVPAAGVIPYEMQNPLFTDYAKKRRFLYVPEGKKITYEDQGAWKFPVGAVLIKHFSYPLDEAAPDKGERSVETRLLIHLEDGWSPEVYVWNAEQTDAERDVTGELIEITRKAPDGQTTTFDYGVPTRAECRLCHGTNPPIEGAQETRALGPMTGQLNGDFDYGNGLENQIDHLEALGLFDRKPPPKDERVTFPRADDEAVSVAERARGYLHANCAHCHSQGGEVFDKDLWLDWPSTDPKNDPYTWGVCKKPTSAGNAECDSEIDIVPGDPDASLLVCRMELVGKGKMAPLGRNLVHGEGVALVRAFIQGLTLPPCTIE